MFWWVLGALSVYKINKKDAATPMGGSKLA